MDVNKIQFNIDTEMYRYIENLKEQLTKAKTALSHYIRRYENGKCWNWRERGDSNGNLYCFDWLGDEADEPWEVAENVLNKLNK